MSVVELEAAPESEEAGFGFDEAFQRKIVSLVWRDDSFASKTAGLIEPAFFENEIDGALGKIALDYFAKYRKTPDKSIVVPLVKDAIAAKMIRKHLLPDLKEHLREVLGASVSDAPYVTDKVVEFAQNKAMERAILASVDDLAKGDFASIKKRMDQALLIGADDGGEYDYFERIETRTEERKARIAGVSTRDGITTGYAEIDKYLYHEGWGRKELSCLMGPAKAGKSMGLGDFAKNASLAGYDVGLLSCEVASEIIAERVDANVSEILMKKLDENAFAVEEAVKKLHAGAGNFIIKDYASGTLKPSMIRRFMEKQRAKGIIIDLLVVDYADICAPEFRSDSNIDNLRSIYIDLRAIAYEYNCAVLTATQTNRAGAMKMTAGATDVAEDFNKARTVDLMLSINSSEAERAAGEARLFFALSRNGESEFSLRIKQERASMRFISKILGRE